MPDNRGSLVALIHGALADEIVKNDTSPGALGRLAEAVANRVLDKLGHEHTVEIRSDGYHLAHPVWCRLEHPDLRCPVDRALDARGQDGLLGRGPDPGRYEVTYEESEVSEFEDRLAFKLLSET